MVGKIVLFLPMACLAISAGCASLGLMFFPGDVISYSNQTDPNVGYCIMSYDSTSEEYILQPTIKNLSGGWTEMSNSSLQRESRTYLEENMKKVGTCLHV